MKGETVFDPSVAVQKALARPVRLTGPDGRQHVRDAQHGVTTMFYQAIKGDKKAVRQVVRLAQKLFDAPPPPDDRYTDWREMDDKTVEVWKAVRLLPKSCPDNVAEIRDEVLGRAVWKYNNNKEKYWPLIDAWCRAHLDEKAFLAEYGSLPDDDGMPDGHDITTDQE